MSILELKGRQRTILVSLFILLMLATGPGLGAIGIIMPALIREFHWDRAQVSSLIFASTFVGGLLGPVVGWLIDYAGANWVMAAGFAILGSSYLGLSYAHTWGAMFTLYSAFGLGMAMSGMVPAMVVAVNWFGHRRGAGSGVAIFGFTLGLAAVAPVVTAIIAAGGWRIALRVLALPPLVIGIPLSAALIRTRPPAAAALTAAQEMALQPGLEVGEGLRTLAFWLLLAVQFTFAIGFGAVFLHIVTYLIGVGFAPGRAAAIFSAQTLMSGVGVVMLGILADRLSARQVLGFSMVVLAAGIAALLGSAHSGYRMPMVLLFILCWGTTATSINTLLPILIAETLGLRRLGTFSGIVLLVGALAHSLGPLLSGILFDLTGSYVRPFELAIVLVFATGLLVVGVRPAKGWDRVEATAADAAGIGG